MSSDPQNLLFIMSDQHSRAMLGSGGHPVVQTPNLDELARQGISFANAYTNSPICVPARASLATGRYPHDIGAWDNAAPYTGDVPSWGHRLEEQGIAVTTIGKLHYRNETDDTGFADQRLPMHVLNGVGDLYTLVREAHIPIKEGVGRKQILDAGPGESSYTQFDRAVTAEAVNYLRNEAPVSKEPWALFVSYACPHFPLIAPQEYYDLYPPERVVFPKQYGLHERPKHFVLEEYRRLSGLADELDEATIRKAIAAYYGLCTFMDAQVGQVLSALRDSGLDQTTRIIYTSDHGDSMGEHGLWFKSTMYEGATAIPLILSGPDLPKGIRVTENVSLVDCFPTILDAVGVPLKEEDRDLPGESLLKLVKGAPAPNRTVFSEYHAAGSITGVFMLRDETYKYVHYVDYPPQLFDLLQDPDELTDLAADPRYKEVIRRFERQLIDEIGDPGMINAAAKQDQARRLRLHGGREHVVSQGFKVPFTPVPDVK
ncbi:sulfatase-like hydrolase/transferase [Paenibacillus sp. NFR01]|uniref:sulfatase-like hydrolase/transferase n=1 Tax=Paenibacillus sp. NFR01 TaxID=1566279 RepID=UPI0008C78471|nr:sulfatase-like hydrolase/transferase [Paenibacillus sp. NFR01]SET06897.1 choline-sulfatase [Paenibacillus sp. NFR01]